MGRPFNQKISRNVTILSLRKDVAQWDILYIAAGSINCPRLLENNLSPLSKVRY